MARSQRGNDRSGRRAAPNKVIEIVLTLIFLAIMLTVILPWAANSLANGFAQQIRTP